MKENFRKESKLYSLGKRMYRGRHLYLMILPGMITVFIFHYLPIYGVQIAFKDFRTSLGIVGSEWVGLKYFKKFIDYPYFGKIMWNTIKISLTSLCMFPIPVFFSVMLNELGNLRFKKTIQTITYAPHFVSTVVTCSIVTLLLDRDGIINTALGYLGVEPLSFMSMPAAFAPIYALSDLWQHLGWNTIIYIATLAGVSPELVEAAKLDGAGRMQIVRHVYLPHLLPTVVTMFILRTGSLLSVGFEKVFLLQNPLNMEASSVISTYVYEVGILSQQYSYSSAIGLFNNIINIILILITNQVSKKITKVGLW